jgi:Fe-Mn family superoxide dismutase
MAHKKPELPWSQDALEPNYKKETLDFHYGKHHQAYVDKLNKALEGTGKEDMPLEQLLTDLMKKDFPEEKRQAAINHGGGHYNHSLFWSILTPNGTEKPEGALAEQITADFGSFESFKEEYGNKAATLFGSGWTWLVVEPSSGKLSIENTANQDNCLMNSSKKPLMVLDLWEHAYYLEHQNRRPDFINAFWKMVDWKKVNENFEAAKAGNDILELEPVAA